ncbi:MAG: hypothetical protein ACRDHD_00310 [Candidatus Limnocylindria bacterium]
MNRSRAALAAMLLALLTAACSSNGSPSAGDASSQDQPTLSPGTAPSLAPSAAASGGALPSLPSGAADLEALIPDQIGGIELQKTSMQGADFINSASGDPGTERFLEDLDVDPEDIAVALGFGGTDATSGVGIFVFRAAGAETDRLLEVFKASSDVERTSPLAWEAATVAGKDVERTVDPEAGDQVIYLYARGDILFLVSASTEEDAEEAIGALP